MKVQVRMRIPEKEIHGCNNCLNIAREIDNGFAGFFWKAFTEVLPQFNLHIDDLQNAAHQYSGKKVFSSYPLECSVAYGKSVPTNCYLRIATEFSSGVEYVTECAIVYVE